LAIDAVSASIKRAKEAGRRLVGGLDVSAQVAVPSIAFHAVCMVAEMTLSGV